MMKQLLKMIAAEARATAADTGRAAFSPRVMQALADVPRHDYVLEADRASAYLDRPLPIGHGQTISQPYIVALMTDLLEVGLTAKVLEVGAGAGYQAAVLARLVREVHTLEIVPELARACRERLAGLGVTNVQVHERDGATGLPEEAPFDGVLVAAAAREVPGALVEQLALGGRMVIPLGEPGARQELVLLEKDERGEVSMRGVLAVRFVPLTGER
ncbi:MAG: protein-L-isoaspartate(D-aspartate) O-methyltransferase [Kiritimatiellae bacterium]|nr:protein-L-isoaspartate(D-aspartate) O-methyltransferase [Kiritimatiellia bacterium]